MRRLHVICTAAAKARTAGDFRNALQWSLTLKIFAIGSLLLLLTAGQSFAQTAPLTPTSPAMGATSPLGTLGNTSSVAPVGIPLGATELSPGGVSPMLPGSAASTDPCSGSGISGGGTSGSGSTFDGAGIATNTIGTSSALSCGGGTASGTISTGVLGGATTGSAAVGTIPLDSTELNNGGVSPPVTSPVFLGACAMSLGSPTTPTASTSDPTNASSSSC
jgi:hypothetical protein